MWILKGIARTAFYFVLSPFILLLSIPVAIEWLWYWCHDDTQGYREAQRYD